MGVVSAADATMRWSPQAGAKWNSITRSIEAGKKFYKVQPSSVEAGKKFGKVQPSSIRW